MATFIANMIIKARNTSLANGQAKYRAYFINLTLYKRYKEKTDAILTSNGCNDCIVTV